LHGIPQTRTIRAIEAINQDPSKLNAWTSPTAKTERQMADLATGREVLVEFQQIGNAVKVTAMDTKSMVEVSIMGPASAGEEVLKRNVINKLNYIIFKKD
jgi:hypothetical protein